MAWLSAALAAMALGCQGSTAALEVAWQPVLSAVERTDLEALACRIAFDRFEREPALPGAPELDRNRAELLGSARGEPVLFVQAPKPTPRAALDAAVARQNEALRGRHPDARLQSLLASFGHRRGALRALLLREGYLYSDDPRQAAALVRQLEVADLFDEPTVWLLRGAELHRLERVEVERRFEYRHAGGALAGKAAKLLLFDRIAAHPAALTPALHRDVRALRDRAAFDRLQPLRLTAARLSAELTYGDREVRALLRADGAGLEIECLDAPLEVREAVRRATDATAGRRRSIARLREVIAALVDEAPPFDRPREAEDHLSDGSLRPLWEQAYRHGRLAFEHEEKTYLVFDAEGRPTPPQTCAAMIVDAFERASGRWYRSRGGLRGRTEGALDFDALGIENRAAVLGIEEFARSAPALFRAHRFSDEERVPFRNRSRFFQGLLTHEDGFEPGDILAIHGPKPDGYVHQHAILVIDVDPMTGFPYALADQMKRPRIRTFEGIMAEAPRRSMFYHLRPTPQLLSRLDPEGDARLAAAER